MAGTKAAAAADAPADPADEGRDPGRGLRAGEALRFVWTQLTSMRTALLLLFALALASIPGSLIPQRPNSPAAVRDFIAQYPALAPWYERLGLFDVFASPWFAAIYLLLFVSLIGCIVPRVGAYARQLRKPPPATPRNLSRLPVHATQPLGEADPTVTLDAAAAHLRRRRFRLRREAGSISAERGYLREFGNLLFHLSLIGVLIGVAWGSLFGFKGSAIVVEGQGFANNVTQYDELTSGPAFKPTDLEPFGVLVDRFSVRFETGSVQRGAAREFSADVRVLADGSVTPAKLEVNHPLTIKDTSVHLLGHGYAALVTVRDGAGNVAFSGPVVFLPQDGNFTSAGVIKAPDARPERLAFEGFFLPTGVIDMLGPRSLFPDALNPELVLNAWHGAPKAETGVPENVYTLDTRGLKQFESKGIPVRMLLKPGQHYDLPGKGGSITFDGWKRWTKLQVSRTPGMWLTLISVALAVTGLCLSLFVRPRRLWLRVADGRIEGAGLDRADARAGLDDDVADLLAAAAGESQAGRARVASTGSLGP